MSSQQGVVWKPQTGEAASAEHEVGGSNHPKGVEAKARVEYAWNGFALEEQQHCAPGIKADKDPNREAEEQSITQ